jgi:peptidoglycan biosynthesis protein MviN/MurJ (putative lipid II flippase)
MLNAVMHYMTLRVRLGGLNEAEIRHSLVTVGLASAALFVVVWSLWYALPPLNDAESSAEALVLLVGAMLAGAAAYFLVAFVRRDEELGALMRQLRRV